MRILITGSRDWSDRDIVLSALTNETQHISPGSEAITLVSGACPSGADYMAESVAKSLGWAIERHPANWSEYGRAAGPIRNKLMVDLGADICLAFIKNNSKGASGTADMAESRGILTIRYRL